MDEQTTPIKRGPGRPRKNPAPKAEAKQEPKPNKFRMKAAPNWENIDATAEDTPDKLRIDPSLVPEGMSLQWVTSEVFGQADPQHRADFERKGWTPVHQEDFDGRFNGMFMARDALGEIKVHGTVLMARPMELTKRAKLMDRRRAQEQVMIKENELRNGNIPISLDPRHPSAVNTNKINKTMERIEIPEN